MPGTMMRPIPGLERIMTHHNELSLYSDLFVGDRVRVKKVIQLGLDVLVIVISDNQMFLSVQQFQDLYSIRQFHKREVAKDIDFVLVSNSTVPVCNQSLSHIFNIREGALAMHNGVSMTKMVIGCKKNHFSSTELLIYVIL
jgi:hypothetical protein